AVERARRGEGPSLVVLHSYRMLGHSSSDDPTKYRDSAEVDGWAARDPLDRLERFLVGRKILAREDRAKIEAAHTAEIDAEIHRQESAEPMALRTPVGDVYADVPPHLRRGY